MGRHGKKPLLGYPLWSAMHLSFLLPLLMVIYLLPVELLQVVQWSAFVGGAFLSTLSVFIILWERTSFFQRSQVTLTEDAPNWQFYSKISNTHVEDILYRGILLFGTIIFSLLLGVVTRNQLESKPSFGLDKEGVLLVEGRVVADSRRSSYGGTLVEVALSRCYDRFGRASSAQGRITVAYGKEFLPLYRGEEVLLRGELRGGGVRDDFQGRSGGDKKAEAPQVSGREIFVGKEFLSSGSTSALSRLRQRVLRRVEEKILSLPTQGSELLLALLLGRKLDPSHKIFSLFRSAGAPHLLALSGMHLAIMGGLISHLSKPLFGKKAARILSMVGVLIYLSLAGYTPSLLRGAIFYTLIGVVKLRGAKVYLFHLLLITLCIQLLIAPYTARDIAFQLSYGALGGILLLSSWIALVLRKLPAWLRVGLSGGVAAQSATIPITLYYFGSWYPVGILAGIILLPCIVLFIWFGLLLLLIPEGLFLQGGCWLFDRLYRGMVYGVKLFSLFPSLQLY